MCQASNGRGIKYPVMYKKTRVMPAVYVGDVAFNFDFLMFWVWQ